LGETPGEVQRFWWGDDYLEKRTGGFYSEEFQREFAAALSGHGDPAPHGYEFDSDPYPMSVPMSVEIEMEDDDSDTESEDQEVDVGSEDESEEEEEEEDESEEESESDSEEEEGEMKDDPAQVFLDLGMGMITDLMWGTKKKKSDFGNLPDIVESLTDMTHGDRDLRRLAKLEKGGAAEACWRLGERGVPADALLLAAGDEGFCRLVTGAAAFSFATQYRRVTSSDRRGEWIGAKTAEDYTALKNALREIVDNFLVHTASLAETDDARGALPWEFFAGFARSVEKKPTPFGTAVVAANLFDLCRKMQTLTSGPAKTQQTSADKLAIAQACYVETTQVFFKGKSMDRPGANQVFPYMIRKRIARGFRFGDDVITPAVAAVRSLKDAGGGARERDPTTLFMALTHSDHIAGIALNE